MSSQALDFAEFVKAARPTETSVGDPLDEITLFLRKAETHIARVEAEVDSFLGLGAGRNYFFSEQCSPESMRDAAWSFAVGRVRALLIEPAKVEVRDVAGFVEDAISGGADGGLTRRELIERWDSARVRNHFDLMIGDPRERRGRELKTKALQKMRGRRPEVVYAFYCGSHHETPFGHTDRCGRLRLTYSSSNLRDLELFVHFVIHLATGDDPLAIKTPVIYGWTDGLQEWPRSEVYRRQKAPFPGAKWMRFTAGSSVEFALEDAVLNRLCAHWDREFSTGQQKAPSGPPYFG